MTTPPERWDADRHYAQMEAKSGIYARFGAYCADIQSFDATFFKLPGSEAVVMDPHTRILLEINQVGSHCHIIH
jgi:acyl transferase domain-containing protein